MSKLDLAKEQIAYLKLWLGILVATIISLTGWLISNFQSVHWLLIFAAIVALSIICFAGYSIHKRIEEKIALSRSYRNDHYCSYCPCRRSRVHYLSGI